MQLRQSGDVSLVKMQFPRTTAREWQKPPAGVVEDVVVVVVVTPFCFFLPVEEMVVTTAVSAPFCFFVLLEEVELEAADVAAEVVSLPPFPAAAGAAFLSPPSSSSSLTQTYAPLPTSSTTLFPPYPSLFTTFVHTLHFNPRSLHSV